MVTLAGAFLASVLLGAAHGAAGAAPGPPEICLLVVADIHYVHTADHVCAVPARQATRGRELLRRACARARELAKPDAVILLGDLVDDGTARGADADLTEIRDEAVSLHLPVVAVRGNHDPAEARFRRVFGQTGAFMQHRSFGFVVFDDPYELSGRCERPSERLRDTAVARAKHPGLPLVALQHSPLTPRIGGAYPYMPVNVDAIISAYRDAGVVLSLSGHYHPGQPPTVVDGVTYATCPALCEAPFRFMIVRIRGKDVTASVLSLD